MFIEVGGTYKISFGYRARTVKVIKITKVSNEEGRYAKVYYRGWYGFIPYWDHISAAQFEEICREGELSTESVQKIDTEENE